MRCKLGDSYYAGIVRAYDAGALVHPKKLFSAVFLNIARLNLIEDHGLSNKCNFENFYESFILETCPKMLELNEQIYTFFKSFETKCSISIQDPPPKLWGQDWWAITNFQ